jgi:acetyl-CoA carboxylase biotin carboxyl carrier protein
VAQPDADSLGRTADERLADHQAIDRLADELLPALVARLSASGLGELDVREGAWRVRLRLPADGRAARRAAGASRGTGPGGAGTHPPAAVGSHATPGADPPGGPAPVTHASPGLAATPTTIMVTAPAVGYFRPGPDLAAGAAVRTGDRLATIDVLGVAHDVVAPADGVVGATAVEPGEPVEYGQAVVEIELPAEPATGTPEAG